MSNKTASTEGAATPRWWQRVLGGSFFLYPLLMHWLIVRNMLMAASAGLAIVSLVALASAWRDRQGRLQACAYGLVAVTALAAVVTGGAFALYLPPVVFNLILALVFGRTLAAGETPLIQRFMRMYYGDNVPSAVIVYARQLTVAWTGFFIASAVFSLGLALFAPLDVWSLFANVINYVLVVLLFMAQFVYGSLRLGTILPSQIIPVAVRMARRAVSRSSIHR